MSNKTLYEVLGVGPDASQDEIKRGYRARSQKIHPDRQGGDENAFKELGEAYSVLSDRARREQYDKNGTTGKQKPVRERAIEILGMWISELIEQGDLSSNIVQQLKARAKQTDQAIHQSILGLQDKRSKIESFRGRVKDQDPLNLFEEIVNRKIQDLTSQIETEGESVEMLDAVMEIIEGMSDSDGGNVIFIADGGGAKVHNCWGYDSMSW